MKNIKKIQLPYVSMLGLTIIALVLSNIFLGVMNNTFAQHSGGPELWIYLERNEAEARNWPLNAQLFLSIDDLGTDKNPDHSETVAAPSGNAHFDFDFDVQPGHIATLTDGHLTKTLIVTNPSVTEIDVDNDTVSGKAQPYATLNVFAWYSCERAELQVTADQDGNWIADFKGLVDIIPGSGGGDAKESDEDYDKTVVHWRVPNPHIQANPLSNWVEAWGWPVGVEVTLTIDDDEDPENGNLFTYTLVTNPLEWDPSVSMVQFGLWNWEFDLQSGHFITMTDGTLTKKYRVTQLSVIINPLSDVVAGIATPGASLSVYIWGFNAERYEIADEAGNWFADFSMPGDDCREQDIFDIQMEHWIDVSEFDDDYNFTRILGDISIITNTPEGLILLIESMPDDAVADNMKNSLIEKIENAIRSLNKGNCNAAIGQLNAFIRQVQALKDRKILDDAADLLIAYAQSLIAQIEANEGA